MTTILQWNCRGLRTGFHELQAILASKRPSIICLQETKLAPNSLCQIRGYTTHRKDLVSDTVAHGGVLLAIHHSVPTRPVPLRTGLQAVAASVQSSHTRFTVCSVYLPPGIALPVAELRQLVAELPSPFLLLGDLNAHHTVWGCDDTDRRGRLLESLLRDERLCLMNTGIRTHVTLPSGQTSAIDLSISSPELAPFLAWSVGEDPMGSDHFPVWLSHQSVAVMGQRPPRWNLRKADWSQFQTRLEEGLCSDQHGSFSVQEFTSLIIESAEACIPRTSSSPRRPPVPWWTDSCQDAISARKRALRAFQRSSTTANLVEYKRAKARARRTVREAKRRSWSSYVSEINRFTPISEVWSRIKRISGKSCSAPLPVLRIGDRDIMHPVEVAEEIARAFSERSRGGCSDPNFKRHRTRCESAGVNFNTSGQFAYNEPFTMEELKAQISSLRNVAEGPDAIHNEMLRHLPEPALEALLALFNSLWERGEYPETWREAVVIPILKEGKTGLEPLHYRPIALTSSLGKLLEKVVNARLTWVLERSDTFANAQCGFRKNRSTVDHILRLDAEIRSNFQNRRHLGAIFFDIEAAYDTTWRLGILLKLFRYGIRGRMGSFLKSFLSDRFFKVRVGNQLSERFPQVNGVPQGGVLSVALFAVMINDIGDLISPTIGRALFVDDLAIWTGASSTRAMERQFQVAVTQLERWSAVNGLRFSTTKTVAVHFCRRRRACPDMTVRLHGEVIPVKPEAKFLGVVLDKRLTYRSHIRTLRDKCMRALNILKCVARTSYGADRDMLLLLYRSLIRSRLDYACFVYDGTYESVKRILNTVHHAAIRIATGAFRTSPVSSLLVEAHEPPLALRRQLLGMRYAIKLRQLPSHPAYEAVFPRVGQPGGSAATRGRGRCKPFSVRMRTLFLESGVQLRCIKRLEGSQTPPWQMILPPVDVSLAETRKADVLPALFKARALEHVATYADHVISYTDGSKTDEGVGCAFVRGETTRSFTLPTLASVYSSELAAIIKVLSDIEVESDVSHLILSDSLSCLLALRTIYPSNPLVLEVLERVTALGREGKRVSFCWIPSHIDIRGNEMADSSAKRAARRPCTRRFPLPASDHLPVVASFIGRRWQEAWAQSQGNKLFALKNRVSRWRSSARRCRREEVTLCRLRIGHTYGTHGYLLCGADRPSCPRCRAPLTVKHVLLQCPLLERERINCFGLPSSQLTLSSVLGDSSVFIDSGRLFSFVASAHLSVIYTPT